MKLLSRIQLFCDPVDCSLPGSSVRGILQARILEWVTISFSRGSSQPRDQTQASRIGGRHFNLWATREVQCFQQNKIEEKLLKKGESTSELLLFYSNLLLVYNHNLFKLTQVKLDGVNKYKDPKDYIDF